MIQMGMSEYDDLQRSCACTTTSDIVLKFKGNTREFLFRIGIVCMSGMNDL